jgi:hypothetical protein
MNTPVTEEMRENAKSNPKLAFTIEACEKFYKTVLPVFLDELDATREAIVEIREELTNLKKSTPT